MGSRLGLQVGQGWVRLGKDWVWGWDQHQDLGHTGVSAVTKVQFDEGDSWA